MTERKNYGRDENGRLVGLSKTESWKLRANAQKAKSPWRKPFKPQAAKAALAQAGKPYLIEKERGT